MLKHQKLQKIQQELRKSLSLIHSSDLHSENELRIMVNNAKPEFDKKRKQIMKARGINSLSGLQSSRS